MGSSSGGERRLTDEQLKEIRERLENIEARGRYSGAVTPSEVIYYEDVRSLLAEVGRLSEELAIVVKNLDEERGYYDDDSEEGERHGG